MRKAFVAIAVALFMVVSLVAYAGHTFRDVPSDHTFHGDIQWGFDNGLTFGCNPADGGDLMCPNDPVTRGQMMAFFNRYHNKMAGDVDIDRIINEVINEITLEGTDICEVFGFANPCADELKEFLRGPVGPIGPAGANGQDGQDGADGADGVDGQDGVDGTDGVSGYEVVRTIRDSGWNLQNSSSDAIIAECPEGKVVVGGGYDVNESSWVNGIHASAPRTNGSSVFNTPIEEYQAPNQWDVRVDANNAGLKVAAFAICATVGE